MRLSIKQLRSLKAITLRSCFAGERTADPSASLGMTKGTAATLAVVDVEGQSQQQGPYHYQKANLDKYDFQPELSKLRRKPLVGPDSQLIPLGQRGRIKSGPYFGPQIALTAGPSTALRSGRDDNSVSKSMISRDSSHCATESSSRP